MKRSEAPPDGDAAADDFESAFDEGGAGGDGSLAAAAPSDGAPGSTGGAAAPAAPAATPTGGQAAGLIRALLPSAAVASLDLADLELLPASFVDAEMAERHADLLFRAPMQDKPAYIHFLFEHQSRPDDLMPFRSLTYLQRIWSSILRGDPERRTLPIVVPIIIHHGSAGWTAPRSLHELVDGLTDLPELSRFIPNFELLIDDLVRLDDQSLLARPLEAFPKVALWVLRDARTIDDVFQSLQAWASELNQLVATDRDPEDMQTILRYILRVAGDVPFETVREKFIEVTPAVEAAMASPAEQLIQRGIDQGVREGLKKGRQEGHQEANRTMLARLLELRFGDLTPETHARIAEASLDDLEHWLDRVITKKTVSAIFAE